MDTSYEKYLEEKAFIEAYGYTSVITYEEWKKIKEIESIKDKIDEIVEGYAECRWLDAGELEIYLKEVVTEQKKIDIDKACEWLKSYVITFTETPSMLDDFRRAMEE